MKYLCFGYYDKGKSDGMLRADKARGIDRQPEMDTSPYRPDCTDHFRTAQDRTIDFSDTTRHQKTCNLRVRLP